MAKLKVYVTPIGFHDAYVAAASQKAALAAWGADRDLFARGAASVVTDEALAKEPLARPGEVIKRLRGTAAEQIAALPPERKKPSKPKEASPRKERAKHPPPAPDRSALDAAEAALRHAEERSRADEQRIEEQIAELEQRLARAEREHAEELKRLRRRREEASAAYDRDRAAYEAATRR